MTLSAEHEVRRGDDDDRRAALRIDIEAVDPDRLGREVDREFDFAPRLLSIAPRVSRGRVRLHRRGTREPRAPTDRRDASPRAPRGRRAELFEPRAAEQLGEPDRDPSGDFFERSGLHRGNPGCRPPRTRFPRGIPAAGRPPKVVLNAELKPPAARKDVRSGSGSPRAGAGADHLEGRGHGSLERDPRRRERRPARSSRSVPVWSARGCSGVGRRPCLPPSSASVAVRLTVVFRAAPRLHRQVRLGALADRVGLRAARDVPAVGRGARARGYRGRGASRTALPASHRLDREGRMHRGGGGGGGGASFRHR